MSNDTASPLGRFLRTLVHEAEEGIDELRARLSGGAETYDRVRLLAYAGYRNADTARLSGRVVKYTKPLDAGEGMLSRLRAMLAIYESDELTGVPVAVEGYGDRLETVSDDEGYFSFELPVSTGRHPLPVHAAWENARLSAPAHATQKDGPIAVPVLAPGRDNRWGVISDIDDTVIETGATNFFKNWRRVLIERPADRLAVAGAATLYGMIAGGDNRPSRPFFYVSSSPWNLYGFITEFMELNGIPHGPMFLKDYGIDDSKFIATGHGAHKRQAIEHILDFYPHLTFLLVGDSGQHDVDIYSGIVETHRDRIGAVFIRDVEGAAQRGRKAEQIAAMAAADVPVFVGHGLGDAVAIVQELGLAAPLETAKATAPDG